MNSHMRLAQEFRKDVRWHLARAARARELGDLEEARWHLERAKVWRVNAHHWATAGRGARSTHQVADTTECCQKIGEAFTQTLLKSSERDFADTIVLGGRLVDELRKRGLTVAPIAGQAPIHRESP